MNPVSPEPTYPSGAQDARAADAAAATEDAALLHRIATGDDAAFATFYDRWVQPVYAVTVQMLHDADDAEDVLEETFWQVWERASMFDPARGTARVWVLTIARSRALDRLRARARRADSAPLAESFTELLASEEPDPSATAEAVERREQVGRALAELPAEQRRTLELAYFGGYTQSEIAEQLHEPLGTVKTRMRLGMQKLRTLLRAVQEES